MHSTNSLVMVCETIVIELKTATNRHVLLDMYDKIEIIKRITEVSSKST